MSYKVGFLILLLLTSNSVYAQGVYDDEVNSLVESILKKKSTNFEIPFTPKKYVPSQLFDNQKPLSSQQGVNIDKLLGKYAVPFQANTTTKPLHFIHPVMVFASFSMPKESLMSLGKDAQKAGSVLVFRGLHAGSFTKTAKAIHALSKEGIPAIIDPLLFKLFDVKVIPTFVAVEDELTECIGGNCHFTPIHDQLSGNVSLKYALTVISEKGEIGKDKVSAFLQKLEEKK